MNQRVDINGEVFKDMRGDLQLVLHNVLIEIFNENFESGDITLKLNVGTSLEFEDVPDGMGGWTRTPYNRPIFNYKINYALQKKDNIDGAYIAEGQVLALENGFFKLMDIEKAQMEMEI